MLNHSNKTKIIITKISYSKQTNKNMHLNETIENKKYQNK